MLGILIFSILSFVIGYVGEEEMLVLYVADERG